MRRISFGARTYNASIGRFDGVDALAEEFIPYSLFSYNLNNPITNVDPSGMEVIPFEGGQTFTGDDAYDFAVSIGVGAVTGFPREEHQDPITSNPPNSDCCPDDKKENTSSTETSVEEPGTIESLVPIWGSGRQSIHDFQEGNYGWGTFNAVMAISDIFLLKSIGTAAVKGAWKLGTHSWSATRKWMLKKGHARPNEPLHHWAISQKTSKRYGLNWLANQPWNLKSFSKGALLF